MDNFVLYKTCRLEPGSKWECHVKLPTEVAESLEKWVDEREKKLHEELQMYRDQLAEVTQQRDDVRSQLQCLQSALVLVPSVRPSFWSRLFNRT